MKPSLIVVPLSGELPFLLEDDSWNNVLLQAEPLERSGDFYIIDPCNKSILDCEGTEEGRVEQFDFYPIRTIEETKEIDREIADTAVQVDKEAVIEEPKIESGD